MKRVALDASHRASCHPAGAIMGRILNRWFQRVAKVTTPPAKGQWRCGVVYQNPAPRRSALPSAATKVLAFPASYKIRDRNLAAVWRLGAKCFEEATRCFRREISIVGIGLLLRPLLRLCRASADLCRRKRTKG